MSAGNVATAYVRLRPNAAGFQREAQAQVNGALSGLRKSAAFLVGAGGIAAGIKGIIEAAAGRQSALVQVQTAVRNAGAEWKVYGKTVEDILEGQENKTGFDFEETAQGFGRLVQQTKSSAEALSLLGTAEDIARARHLELAQVTVALSRAQAGNSQSLSRLGIIIPKYTAQLDAIKKREDDVAKAQQAKTQAAAGDYQGTINLTDAQRKLAALSPIQLQNLANQLKASEAGAAAADKRRGAELAVAEVSKRYSGQAAAFANTAAGSYARFRVAIQQVAEAIGGAALPRLTDLAQGAARVALELSKNEKVGRVTTDVLDNIAGGAQAVVTAFHAVEPALRLVAQTANAIGPGPILATIAAYKALGLVQSAVALTEGKYQGLVKAGTPATIARAAAIEASNAANAGAIASGQRLITYEAAIAEGYSAQTAAVFANNGAMVTNTELTTLNVAAKIRSGEVAAIQAEGWSLATAANRVNNGQLITNTELTAANTLVKEANVAAAGAQTAATGGWRAALAGLGTKLTGPTGIIAGVALLAGGLYYLSTREGEVQQRVNNLTGALERQTSAVEAARAAADQAQQDTNRLPGQRDSRALALAELTKAQYDYDVAASGGHATRATLATDADRIAQAQARWRDANRQVVETERDKVEQLKESAKQTGEARKAVEEAARNAVNLIDKGPTDAEGNNTFFKPNPLGVQQVRDAYNALNKAADDSSKKLTEGQRARLRALADKILELKRRPTQIEVDVILNTDAFNRQLAGIEGSVFNATRLLRGGLDEAATSRGEHAETIIKHATDTAKGLGKKAGTDFTDAFVTRIDASQIKTAFTDAITQAQSQLVSEAGTLAGVIGEALDAKLKAETLPATREIERLQAQIAATQASTSARDSAQTIADAAKKLADLQRIFGGGALTSDQAQQVAQARVALLDAQDAASSDSKQRRIADLQSGVDAASSANDAAKAAAARRLADLTAELNNGVITQRQYVKRLNALLASEGVNYKTTGKLLGVAFADGFRDGLASVLAQAAALGGVGKGNLRNAPKGTRAVDPNKAEADAIQAFIDQVAQSGGKFSVTGAGSLPGGITLDDLLARAGSQRSADTYRTPSSAKDRGLDYAGRTADHTAVIASELKKLNAKPPVVVNVDGRKSKRKAAEATRS